MRLGAYALSSLLATATLTSAQDATRIVWLEDRDGNRIEIAELTIDADGGYDIAMKVDPFTDHFLSMRPFKCLEGPDIHLCHVPYPYPILRQIGDGDLTDLEYDFMFLWKRSGEYGINMWNGVYYQITAVDDRFVGALHEVNMDLLSVPPKAGDLRPLKDKHLDEGDPDSHWLPRLVID